LLGFDSAQPTISKNNKTKTNATNRCLSGVEGNSNEGNQRYKFPLVRRRNMPYMYILKCNDGSYYTGSTWNLEKRLWEHHNGLGANHTSKRLPVKLVYCEECDRVEDAYFREKQIQGWSRKKKQALITGNTNILNQLSSCQNLSHYENNSNKLSL